MTTHEIPFLDMAGVPPLELEELKLLLGLVRRRRKHRERDDAKLAPRSDQTREEFFAVRESHARTLAFLRSTEDHLIELIGQEDPAELWPHEQQRLAEIETARRQRKT